MKVFKNWRLIRNASQEQKNIELESKKLAVQLAEEESNRLKTSFMENVSDEMRNPLNGILGLSQVMLKYGNLTPEIQNDVKLIAENGKTLLTFVNNVIDDTKLRDGQISLRKSPNCLNTLMNKLHKSFQSSPAYLRKKTNEESKLELLCDIPSKNVSIMCDPERLNQVLVNLLDNAIKFTNKGTIRFGYSWSIDTLSKNQYITFFVKDTGIGIEKERLPLIFDRFVQLDNSITKQYKGSGLGLHISKCLAELMGGKIWCESEVGKGSTFYFGIPYSPSYVIQDNDKPLVEADKPHNWSGYTVLIVEDDIINYKVLGGMLRNTKVSIIHSDNGVKAVEQVKLNPNIDLVLMDIQLPEMDGCEATEKILEINPTLPIIAQTANEKERCLEAGCIDYIAKPIDMNLLFNKMSKFLL